MDFSSNPKIRQQISKAKYLKISQNIGGKYQKASGEHRNTVQNGCSPIRLMNSGREHLGGKWAAAECKMAARIRVQNGGNRVQIGGSRVQNGGSRGTNWRQLGTNSYPNMLSGCPPMVYPDALSGYTPCMDSK